MPTNCQHLLQKSREKITSKILKFNFQCFLHKRKTDVTLKRKKMEYEDQLFQDTCRTTYVE